MNQTKSQKAMTQEGYYLNEVRARAEKAHSHFFDRDTMHFFSSRISELCWKIGTDIYFITSEKDRHPIKHKGSKRAYTIRKIDDRGDIKTISQFQEYASMYQARKAVKRLVGLEVE